MAEATLSLRFTGLGPVPPAQKAYLGVPRTQTTAVGEVEEVDELCVCLPPTATAEYINTSHWPRTPVQVPFKREMGSLTAGDGVQAFTFSRKVVNVRGALRLIGRMAYTSENRQHAQYYVSRTDIADSLTFQDALVMLEFLHKHDFHLDWLQHVVIELFRMLGKATSLKTRIPSSKEAIGDWLDEYLALWPDTASQPKSGVFVRAYVERNGIAPVHHVVWGTKTTAIWMDKTGHAGVACDIGDFLYRMSQSPEARVVFVDRSVCAVIKLHDKYGATCYDAQGKMLYSMKEIQCLPSPRFKPPSPHFIQEPGSDSGEDGPEYRCAPGLYGPYEKSEETSIRKSLGTLKPAEGAATVESRADGMPESYHPGILPRLEVSEEKDLMIQTGGEPYPHRLCLTRDFKMSAWCSTQAIATTVYDHWKGSMVEEPVIYLTHIGCPGYAEKDYGFMHNKAGDTIFTEEWDGRRTSADPAIAHVKWSYSGPGKDRYPDTHLKAEVLTSREDLLAAGNPLVYPADDLCLFHAVSGVYNEETTVGHTYPSHKRPRLIE